MGDQMVEVPKIIEIPREILIEDEQIIEIPRYIENIDYVYHHTSHETQYKQKELQHKKRIGQSVFEQKQVTIKPKVVHEHVPRLSTTRTIASFYVNPCRSCASRHP